MNTLLAFPAALTLLPAAMLLAGPLKTSDVGAGAGWVIHHDHEAWVQSRTLAELKKLSVIPEQDAKLDSLRELLGFNLDSDLSSVTLYGSGETDHGVAILKGNFNVAKFKAAAQLGEDFSAEKKGEREIWTVTGDNGRTIRGLVTPNQLVISQFPEDFEAALQVLDGKAPALAAKSLPSNRSGFFGWVNFKAPGVQKPDSPLFSNSEELYFNLREQGDAIRLSAMMSTGNEETARNLSMMSQGLLGFAAGDKKNPFNEEIRQIKIKSDGGDISLEASITVDRLKAVAEDAKKKGNLPAITVEPAKQESEGQSKKAN